MPPVQNMTIGRFFVEGMRVDPSLLLFGLRSNQWTALLAILVGLVVIIVQSRRHIGVETSVYLPGRSNPQQAFDRLTSDPERFFHVLDPKPAQEAGADGSEPETEPAPARS